MLFDGLAYGAEEGMLKEKAVKRTIGAAGSWSPAPVENNMTGTS
jgi:hypothetical protein